MKRGGKLRNLISGGFVQEASGTRIWAEALEDRTLLSSGTALSVLDLPPLTQLASTNGLLSNPTRQGLLAATQSFLKSRASALGLTAADLAGAKVVASSTDTSTGVSHVSLLQRVNVLDVANATLEIYFTPGRQVSHVESRFIHVTHTSATRAALTASTALLRAESAFGLNIDSTRVAKQTNGLAQILTIKLRNGFTQNAPVALGYVAVPSGLVLVWHMLLRTAKTANQHQVSIDAATGAIVENGFVTSAARSSSAPAAPDLADVSDSGSSQSDNITFNNNSVTSRSLTFAVGNTSANATVSIYADGIRIGSVVATGTTASVVTDGSTVLTDGVHLITARQTAPGLSDSPDSTALSITIDTVAPPTPGVPVLEASSDSGVSNSDRLTNDVTPTFDVTGSEAGQLHIQMDGADDSVSTISGVGTWQVIVGTQSAVFGSPVLTSLQDSPASIVSADFNRDGIPDLAESNTNGVQQVHVLLGNGDGSFHLGADPALLGIAVQTADLNSDGIPDLVADGSSIMVSLGHGDGTFASPATLNASLGSLAIADVTGDGIPDLVGVQGNGLQVVIFPGVGDGTFLPSYAVQLPFSPVTSISVSDLNGDGHPDLVIMTNTNDFYFLAGNGYGSFQAPLHTTVANRMSKLVVADFNGDGKQDLAGIDNQSNVLSIMLGNGDGTFQSQIHLQTGHNSVDLVAADLNRDGKPDLAVADSKDGAVSLFMGNGDGSFSSLTLSAGQLPGSIVAIDANRDSRLDLVVLNQQDRSLGAYLQTGGPITDGTHQFTAWAEDTAGNTSAISAPLSVTFDTVASAAPPAPDLEAASDSGASNSDNITNISRPTVDTLGAAPYIRLYRDNILASSSYNVGSTVTLASLADGTHNLKVTAVDAAGNESRASVPLVLTVDTLPPVVVATLPAESVAGGNRYDFSVTVTDNVAVDASSLLNGGTLAIAPGNIWLFATVDSVDAATNGASGTAHEHVVPFHGTWSYVDNGSYPVSIGPRQIRDTAGNFAATSLGAFNVSIPPSTIDLSAGYDTGVSDSDNITRLNNSSPAAILQFNVTGVTTNAAVEVFADGVLVGSGTNAALFTNATTIVSDGPHVFTARQIVNGVETGDSPPLVVTIDTVAPPTPPRPDLQTGSDTGVSGTDDLTASRAPVFDVPVNGPGALHLEVDASNGAGPQVAVAGAGTVSLSVSDGSSPLKPAQLALVPNPPTSIQTGDVNGDGIPDLLALAATSNPSPLYLLIGNGNGTFQAPTLVATIVSSFLVADLNRDGRADLILTANGSPEVLLSNPDGTFGHPLPLALRQDFNYTAVADVNGDGFPDLVGWGDFVYVVDGFGDGTFSAPDGVISASQVTDVKVADFNQDGKIDIVATLFNKNVVTLLAKVNGFQPEVITGLSNTLVSLTVADFNGDGKPDLVGADLAHNVFSLLIGLGNGGFQIQHPNVATSTGYVAGDFNGDGKADLVAVLGNNVNLYNGNGAGAFTSQTVLSGSTAVIASGDLNLDGKPDLLATINNLANVGVFLAAAGPLVDGLHRISAWTEDVAGNHSAYSAPLAVTIDATPPTASVGPLGIEQNGGGVPYTFTVTYADATGIDTSSLVGAVSVTGPGFTSQPILVGVSPAGNGSPRVATYQLLPPDGIWNKADNGTYTVAVVSGTARDVAGNTILAANLGNFNVNVVDAPSVPVLVAATDSGISNQDGVTNFNNGSVSKALQFSVGGTVSGAFVQILADGIVIGSAFASGTSTMVTTSGVAVLADGTHSITSRQLGGGNPSPLSNPVVVTVDTIAPLIPSLLTLEPASDSGISNSDLITNKTNLIFDLANPGGDYFQLSRNGVALNGYQLGTTITVGNQPPGANQYRIRFSDLAGNLSALGPALGVTVDVAAPQVTFTPIGLAGNPALIDHVTVQFSEAVAGVSLTSFNLTRDGSPNLLTSQATLTYLGDNAWQLGNLSLLTSLPGQYTLTFLAAAGVTDIAGNAPATNSIVQWSYDPLAGTPGNDTYYLKADIDGQNIDVWLNQPTTGIPTLLLPRSLSPISIHGVGGADTVTLDQSNGDFLPPTLSIDSIAGTVSLKVFGTTGNDSLGVGPDGQILFGTKMILANQLSYIEYSDDGGDDHIGVAGAVPFVLDEGAGTDTLDLASNVSVQVVVPSTAGNLIINGQGMATLRFE